MYTLSGQEDLPFERATLEPCAPEPSERAAPGRERTAEVSDEV
jgi:hypothetical protein